MAPVRGGSFHGHLGQSRWHILKRLCMYIPLCVAVFMIQSMILRKLALSDVESTSATDEPDDAYIENHTDSIGKGKLGGGVVEPQPESQPEDAQHAPLALWKAPSRAMAVEADSRLECEPRTVKPRSCSNIKKQIVPLEGPTRTACHYDVTANDVIFGVWHSKATEERLGSVLETWGDKAQIVLLASSKGARQTQRYKNSQKPGSRPLLIDTGVGQDDYFSTLGKALIGLELMLEAFPQAKWFVILGDDNFVLLENYLNVLSAFNPEEPWALTRMVYREAFHCKVAGGAGIVTSATLTRSLVPHLRTFFAKILKDSGGNVNKAPPEAKYHDIAFQTLVESLGYTFTHIDEFLHEPPGYYFNAKGVAHPGMHLPNRPAILHYVAGSYMKHLEMLSNEVCLCMNIKSASAEEMKTIAQTVVVGVYTTDKKPIPNTVIKNTWGSKVDYVMLHCDGHDDVSSSRVSNACHLQRLAALLDHCNTRASVTLQPGGGAEGGSPCHWVMLVTADSYVVVKNVAARIAGLDHTSSIVVHGNTADMGGHLVPGSEPILMSAVLASKILVTAAAVPPAEGGDLPSLLDAANQIDPQARITDPEFWHMAPTQGKTGQSSTNDRCTAAAVISLGSPFTGLKPEFMATETKNKLAVAHYLAGGGWGGKGKHTTCTVSVL